MKPFKRSAAEDMMTYIKSPLKRNTDCFIIRVRTNDLRSKTRTQKPLQELL